MKIEIKYRAIKLMLTDWKLKTSIALLSKSHKLNLCSEVFIRSELSNFKSDRYRSAFIFCCSHCSSHNWQDELGFGNGKITGFGGGDSAIIGCEKKGKRMKLTKFFYHRIWY